MNPIPLDEFARLFPLRANNLMWLLGAGASAAAGLPTATDMIWEFKQHLYVTQRRVSLKSVSDLSNPAIRNQLQGHIDSSGRFPSAGAPNEYAALFEEVWPNEADRQVYIDGKVSGGKPSYGHLALATLMKAGAARIVWTTNFDPLVADAAAKVFDGTGALTTVALDAPDLAADTIRRQRWPVEIKLHGDFRSRRLKNTSEELRHQDAKLRQQLVDACQQNGLVVAGYSGRDESIMDALEDAVSKENAFPAGLFWLHRGEHPPLERVTRLLNAAKAKGITGGLVSITNFDEIMRDLTRLFTTLDMGVLNAFAAINRPWTPAPNPTGRRGWPVVRLNALPIVQMPTHCRRVLSKIGGYKEIRAAVATAGVDVMAARVQAGVLAFGRDADVKAAFASYGITEFDLYPIEKHRLRYDSGERGLLREALSRGLARSVDLTLQRHRGADLIRPQNEADARWQPLRDLVGHLSGTVPGQPTLRWFEGAGIRLDWADEKLWLLIEPRVVFEGITAENRAYASDFGRERTVKRYNMQMNKLIGVWCEIIAMEGAEIQSLGIGDGIDAVFKLDVTTAFSRRAQA